MFWAVFVGNSKMFWAVFVGNSKMLHRPEKVDTEKIFQLNNFSKVDNSDNFV